MTDPSTGADMSKDSSSSRSMAKLARAACKLGIDRIERHLFLCADQTKPKCCELQDGLASWDYLKQRLDQLGLTRAGGVYRTKANCLRICQQGPIAVVYPEKA